MSQMTEKELYLLLENLVNQSKECEWLEFKENFHSPEEIGELLSALANGASLCNQRNGYLVYGVKDIPRIITGTKFVFSKAKKGNEELEHWILQRLNPRIDFRYFEFDYEGSNMLIFEVPAAVVQPIRFANQAYIRIGSITRNLIDFPEKENKLWNKKTDNLFE
jgi:ATP-dependent DNA helicase RecG